VSAARRVVVLIHPRFQSLDALGPIEVFDHTRGPDGAPAYRIEVVAPQAGPCETSSGVRIEVPGALAEATTADLDTLVVAGGTGVYDLLDDQAVLHHVRRLADAARRVASVCSGAYLLCEAGLLDGCRVTTHWLTADHLAARYPNVEVDPEPIFIRQGRFVTSAGVTAGMDLALHLVEEDHGPAVALGVARSLVLFLRRPGTQAQLSAPLTALDGGDDGLADLERWVRQHLDRDLSVDVLAARVHQSPRTFARRFSSRHRTTPARWVEALRLEHARRLLEETDLAVAEVARRSGMTTERLRRSFERHLGVPPREYRRRFGVPIPDRTTDHTRSAS